MTDTSSPLSPVELATELTVAWLSNTNTRTASEDIPAFLTKMHQTLTDLMTGLAAPSEAVTSSEFIPAVTARKSLASRDHIISMIDGKPYKTLRRHLATHGLTPDEYRQRYGLRADYPMVAPAYSEARSVMARTIGLGRKAGTKVDARKGGKPAGQ